VLNLYLAIILNAMQAQHEAAVEDGQRPEDPVTLELSRVRDELAALRAAVANPNA
jgi:hypothetical protein